jgi:hypothetical protein
MRWRTSFKKLRSLFLRSSLSKHSKMSSVQHKFSCQACLEEQPNQLAHMDFGGCMYPYDQEENHAQQEDHEEDHEEDQEEDEEKQFETERYNLFKNQINSLITRVDIFYQNYRGFDLEQDVHDYLLKLLYSSSWFDENDKESLQILLDIVCQTNCNEHIKGTLAYLIETAIETEYDF